MLFGYTTNADCAGCQRKASDIHTEAAKKTLDQNRRPSTPGQTHRPNFLPAHTALTARSDLHAAIPPRVVVVHDLRAWHECIDDGGREACADELRDTPLQLSGAPRGTEKALRKIAGWVEKRPWVALMPEPCR